MMYERNITKGEVHYNLYTKPLKASEIEYDDYGRLAYARYSKNTTRTLIIPKTKCVASVRRYRAKELYKNNKK